LKAGATHLRVMLAVRLLSVLALMLVAFAHKPINIASAEELLLAEYVLPDGTYPVLCITDHAVDKSGHGHDQHLHNSNVCEACRISSAYLCPQPAPSTGAAPQMALALTVVPSQPVLWRDIYPPSAPPQAPPFA
jgi:hypothetical protein